MSEERAAGTASGAASPGGDDASSTDAEVQPRLHTEESPYVESPIIMTAVRVVAPFVLTYGLFITFHGASSAGGGFQGGAIIGTVVLMLAFAFGIDSTRQWLHNKLVVGLVCGGVVVFAGIGLGGIALGGRFLEYTRYGPLLEPLLHLKDPYTVKWGMEAVEIGGIATIVSGVIIGLFFATAAGFAALRGDQA